MNMSFRVKILIVAASIFILKHYPTSATTSRNVCSGNSCYASDEDYKNLTLKWMTASQTFNQLIWPERSKLIHILQDFISSDVGLSKSCKSSCRLIIDGLKENKLWALKFLDSSGRGRAGMAYGYTSDVGNLDECITNDVTVKGRRMNGKYCLLNLNLPLLSKEQVHPLHGVNFSLKKTPLEGTVYDLYSIFVEMMMYSPAGFKFGLCLPASCSAESVEKFINKKLEGTELSASFSPHCDTIDDGFETHHVIIIGICVSYVLFVAFCTAWTWNREDDGLIDSYHQYFNIFHNTNKLFVETKDPVSKQISFFHGIRFFYQLAAITFHTIDIFPFLPTVYATFYIRDWPFWLFKQGYASIGFFVQIPFAVSGFLTYVTMYPYFKLKKGKVSFGDYIFKRWFRTTPTIFGVILFGFAWSAFGRGPVHKEAQDMTIEKCKTWWWTNLLYINNWWHFNDMCIFHTWTYSADFQLYTLCFITFMLMIRDKRKGLLSILCFITFGCCASAAVTYFKDLAAYPNFHAVDARQYDYSTWFYFHTYHTIPAYFIGVLTAYLFLEKKQIPDSWIPVVWVIVVSMGKTLDTFSILYFKQFLILYNRSLNSTDSSLLCLRRSNSSMA